MKKPTKICKICGKEYEYCMSLKPKNTPFIWQDVACCPEHGSLYFAKVLKARGEDPKKFGFEDPDKKKEMVVDPKEEVVEDSPSQDTPKEGFVNHDPDHKSKKRHNR